MYATNTISISERQEDLCYDAIEAKLTKLGFDETKTTHFSFKGTRLNISEDNMVYQVIFEFGNNGEFYNLSCDLSKSKKIRIKTIELEDQNYWR